MSIFSERPAAPALGEADCACTPVRCAAAPPASRAPAASWKKSRLLMGKSVASTCTNCNTSCCSNVAPFLSRRCLMRVFRLSLFIVFTVSSLAILNGSGPNDWPAFGNDAGGTKYSPLAQITPGNVARLAIAWTYDTGEKGGGFRGWSVTPLVVDNVMYFGTYAGKLVALNAETGAELWTFDLKTISPSGRYSPRGISYWPGDAQTPARIVATTTDGLLTQVNAKNGELVRIGEKGYVDLKIGVTEKFGGGYNVAAPPAIFKDIAILAPTTGEQGRYGNPGDIRGFDLRTGKELWRFHTVPQPGEANFGTWGAEGWQDRRGPGTWVNMTVDLENGLVFIPMGQPTDQNFGGSRPGSNLYSSSLVALEAATGRLKWYYQMTHHDIY